MRKDKYEEIGSPELSASVTCFTGAGNAVVKVLGSFEENVSVDSDSYRVKI